MIKPGDVVADIFGMNDIPQVVEEIRYIPKEDPFFAFNMELKIKDEWRLAFFYKVINTKKRMDFSVQLEEIINE